jgi:hypothetical protein
MVHGFIVTVEFAESRLSFCKSPSSSKLPQNLLVAPVVQWQRQRT